MADFKPMSHVEIQVSCNKLTNKDLLSKSDPCCVMFLLKEGIWQEVGRTETIMNNLNPCFERVLECDYYFDEVQMVRFEVYDIDDSSEKLSNQDFLGQFETSMAEVVSESPLTKSLVEKKGSKPAGGTITLRVTDSNKSCSNQVLQLTFRAEKLDKKDMFGKSDPFLEFFKKTFDNGWALVHRTEVIKNNLNPTWKPLKVTAHHLSGGDFNNQIKVVCRDWNSDGKHDLIGSFTTSVAELIKEAAGKQWPCINETKVNKKKYENSGTIFLTSTEVTSE